MLFFMSPRILNSHYWLYQGENDNFVYIRYINQSIHSFQRISYSISLISIYQTTIHLILFLVYFSSFNLFLFYYFFL
ncbi:hypothetical protein VIGAN_04221100 [Vigna angularis var. angularis]|uniref:Uncharacterized protein n=1 Tax=Vigna angularis var. angularis TaxID=157739 RepID=A0A0S3RW26_PHAAN|nr:hypothetical protein VIGAN_04221100 [Vigna angularis var. angularis]